MLLAGPTLSSYCMLSFAIPKVTQFLGLHSWHKVLFVSKNNYILKVLPTEENVVDYCSSTLAGQLT